MESGKPPVWLIVVMPLLFLILFPLMWCGVLWINSRLSGWNRLARHYRTDKIPSGKLFSRVQGHIGLVSYRAVLECTANGEGLFLRPAALFRFAHPLLFIPWTEMHDVRRSALLWIPLVRAEIGHPRLAGPRLAARVFDESEGRLLVN